MRTQPSAMVRAICLLLITLALPTVEAHAQHPVDRLRTTIDTFWGEGLPIADKLRLFDAFWTTADTNFAAFHNLDVDWDALRARYRPEIEAGVSRGRFAGIMNHLAMALRERHSFALDSLVNLRTEPAPGVPVMYAAVWGDNGHFGACLTALSDHSLLVYETRPDHPLGLEPGDLVVGYDGLPWHQVYPLLLEAEVPLSHRSRWGSAPSAFTHSWLISAGMNWHLFDEITVVKHGTRDTLHLSVAPLEGQSQRIMCSEQVPVPGIARPDPVKDEYITWGLVDGTSTGYIYVRSWIRGSPRRAFFDAVHALTREHETDGLIIDFRMNPGGIPLVANDGLALLFDTTIPTLGVATRQDPADHFSMISVNPRSFGLPGLDIPGDPATYYDKPIAVLTGPGAFSAGDYNAVRLSFHPRARLFGKSTSSSFAPATSVLFDADDWHARVSHLDVFLVAAPDQFLTHTERRIDEPVWLTPEDVVRGEDTIVKAALAWINRTLTPVEREPVASSFHLSANYPNPFSKQTTIRLTLSEPGPTTLTVYDLLGRAVATLIDEPLPAGTHHTTLNADGLASGLYFYVLSSGNHVARKSMILTR